MKIVLFLLIFVLTVSAQFTDFGNYSKFFSFENGVTTVMNFDGIDDFIALADTIYYAGDYTVLFRMIFDSVDTTPHFFGHNGAGSNYIQYNSAGHFRVEGSTTGDYAILGVAVGGLGLEDDEWHDIGLRFDSLGVDTCLITLYTDGDSVAVDTLFDDSLAISYISAVATPLRELNGSMWDARIYNSILTNTQIADYSAFKAIPTTTLIHRWLGYGTNANVDAGWVDQVGSSDGTVNGTPINRSYK